MYFYYITKPATDTNSYFDTLCYLCRIVTAINKAICTVVHIATF